MTEIWTGSKIIEVVHARAYRTRNSYGKPIKALTPRAATELCQRVRDETVGPLAKAAWAVSDAWNSYVTSRDVDAMVKAIDELRSALLHGGHQWRDPRHD